MSKEADAIDAAIRHLEIAPFDSNHWVAMLAAARDATGSSNCQFMAVNNDGVMSVNLYAEPYGEENLAEWVAMGGPDPARNPFVGAGTKMRPSQIIADPEIISEEERRIHPLLGDLYVRLDIPHIGIAKLAAAQDAHCFTTVLRTAKQGPITANQRAAFQKISKEIARATRLALAVGGEGARLLSGAFDTLSMAAFIFDGFGQLMAVSPAAESLLREGKILKLDSKRLRAPLHADTLALQAMLRGIIHRPPGSPPLGPERIVLRNTSGALAAQAEGVALPPRKLGIGAAVAMLIVQRLVPASDSLESAMLQFGLTRAELEVAKLLSKAKGAREIAAARKTSIETVRSQIKSIFAKTGAPSHPAFIAMMGSRHQL